MPDKATVLRWLSQDTVFRDQYARAREDQADALFEEVLEISDDGTNDWMGKKSNDGDVIGWQENGEALRRSALRISARQWIAAKLRPKKYGDKVALAGHDGGALTVIIGTKDAGLL